MVSRKLANIRSIIRKAKEVKDPLAVFTTAFRLCSSNVEPVQIRSYHAKDMPKELHEWCLATCRENMAALYERVWTWNDTKKRKQLSSAASRFLIAHDAGAGRTPLAYVNYRFEEDEGHAVLYCYELQVVRAAQSRGLGRLLMELTEQIAWGSGMSKLVLTVFCENTAAVAFYRKLGYVLDETSPDYCPSGSNLVSSSGVSSAGGDSGSNSSTVGGGKGSAGGNGGSSSVGAGSTGNSSLCSFNDGSNSGSQMDSAGAGSGYHIMSKCAPSLKQQQHAPPGLQWPVAPQHQESQNQEQLIHDAGEPGNRVRLTEDPPLAEETQLESNKRQRTGASELHPQAGLEARDVPPNFACIVTAAPSEHQMPSLGLQAERRVPADCKSLALQRELAEQLLLPSPHQLLHPPPPPQQPLEQQSLVHVLSDMPQEEQQLQVQQVLEQS